MTLGINRATSEISRYLFSEKNSNNSACIFLSHRSLDKKVVRRLADYIAKAGIDYYLDEEDKDLQKADKDGDDNNTVACIRNGIDCSTHILCILSDVTVSSWWVPYEIGYGERGKKEIASLKIKNLSEREIPAFLRINNCMMGLADFNKYLSDMVTPYKGIFDMSKIKIEYDFSDYSNQYNDVILGTYNENHPLHEIIDQ